MNDALYTISLIAIWGSACAGTALSGYPLIYMAAVAGTLIVSVMKGHLA